MKLKRGLASPRKRDKMRDFVTESIGEVVENDENVLLAYIFGSYAREYITPLSDVDVAVLLKENDLRNLSELWGEIAKALGTNEDNIDLVDLSQATALLKSRVLKQGIKLVDRGNYEEKIKNEIGEIVEDSDGELDKEVLKSRIDKILQQLEMLEREILSKPLTQIIASGTNRLAMERSTQIVIEAVVDICRHIASVKRLGMPSEYKDLLKLLANSSFLPQDLTLRLEKYVGLRNILVHRYFQIDYEKLYQDSKELTKDGELFVQYIRKLIEEG